VGYKTIYSAEIQPTFQKNMSPQSSGSDNKPIKKQVANMEAILAASFVLKLHSVALVSGRTIPTERQPLVTVSANFCG
jgi:hypothetical protein